MQSQDHGTTPRQSSGDAVPIVMPPTFTGGAGRAGVGHMPVPAAIGDSEPVGPLLAKRHSQSLIRLDRTSETTLSF